ncbi:MAG: sigma 54-dependent Fis family transcriptional regulator [Deltaproteobacteria bacterium]|nr:sigma 54-dependent Fis family transcriptional regulator [Deltaproteobacteria bacterium]
MTTHSDIGGFTSTDALSTGRRAGSGGIEVIVVAGPSAGQSWVLERTSLRIGSREGCELVLDDRSVSGAHAEVAIVPGGIRVRDLGSKNGVFVGQARINDAVLAPGTILRVGRSEIALGSPDLPVGALRDSYGDLYGVSEPMQRVFALLERLEKSEATVLVLGETGSGKELAARAIHQASRRASGPFVVFDCASVARDIAESELFGHLRGSFTGAVADRVGAIERASGGTLMLDEIGDLAPDLQPKLLRALESREVKPVGGSDFRKVDIRVLAATHRDLATEVAKGTFRQDLYFRLAVVQLKMPALRERREDIRPTAEHMLLEAGRSPAEARHLAERVAALRAYAWPGNCRELKNALDHLVALGEIPPHLAGSAAERPARPVTPYHAARAGAVEEFERVYVEALVKESGGVIAQACRIAGIDRNVVRRLFRKYGHGAPGR